MKRLLRRMGGAARLHADTYEEVEADSRSLPSAALVVLLAASSGALGTLLRLASAGVADDAQVALQALVSFLLPFVVWVGGSAFSYMTGASFFRGPETQTDFPEVLRTTGFAFTPGLLLVLQALPPAWLGISLSWAALAWTLVAGVVAIRQALDFTTVRAVGTFGSAALLLWLMVWGLVVVPLPF